VIIVVVLGKFTWAIDAIVWPGWVCMALACFSLCVVLMMVIARDLKMRYAWLRPPKEGTADLPGGRGSGQSAAMATTTRERKRELRITFVRWGLNVHTL
jgi:hypothetical protein